jgi:hypothetical protein
MNDAAQIGFASLVTGTIASVVSAGALAALAAAEDKSAVQPVNATSHWLHGDAAAAVTDVDVEHTGVGYATHHASAVFWAVPFEAWQHYRPAQSTAELVRDAVAMSAVAAVVDYGLTPRRLTPGWEHVLSKPSMIGAFAALAAGLAVGAMVTRRLRDS